MKITIFSLGGLLGQYVTNTALLHGAQVTAYVPDAKAIWPRKNMTVIEPSEPGTRAGGTAGSGCSHQRADSDACETCKRRGDTAG